MLNNEFSSKEKLKILNLFSENLNKTLLFYETYIRIKYKVFKF